jgi:hypothetical protein
MNLDVPYYDEEDVIGSASKYHRPSCHLIANIYRRNLTRLQTWKKAVDLGLEPCRVCGPFYEKSGIGSISQKESDSIGSSHFVPATQLADWRRSLVQLLDVLDRTGQQPGREGVVERMMRLQRDGIIPREIIATMRTLTEMRNATEYQSKILSLTESTLVVAAWAAIREWAIGVGVQVSE